MIMNKSYLAMKLIAIACIIFFFQNFFALSFLYIFEPQFMHLRFFTPGPWGMPLWMLDFLYGVFLLFGFSGAVLTFNVNELGRRLLIFALVGIALVYFLTILKTFLSPDYADILLTADVPAFAFLLGSYFVLTHRVVKEHFKKSFAI